MTGQASTRSSRGAGRAVAVLMLVVVAGCADRPADGVISSGSIASRSVPDRQYRRVAGFETSAATGVQLWYERFGDPRGETVVLLNGSDAQAIYWPEHFIVDLLDAGYSVIRYDARDAGLSEWLPFPDGFDPGGWTPEVPPPYPLDVHVDDLWGLLDRLGIGRAHLLGVSQGGMIAQLAAIDDPRRVLSLTLLSTTPSNPYDERFGPTDPALLDYLIEQFPIIGRTAFLPSILVRSRLIDLQTDLLAEIAGIAEPDRVGLRAYVEATYDRAGLNPASSQGFAVAAARSRIDQLAAIEAPTLILHGRDDRMIRPGHATALAEAIPGARLIWVEGGHGFPFQMYSARTEAMLDNLVRGRQAPP